MSWYQYKVVFTQIWLKTLSRSVRRLYDPYFDLPGASILQHLLLHVVWGQLDVFGAYHNPGLHQLRRQPAPVLRLQRELPQQVQEHSAVLHVRSVMPLSTKLRASADDQSDITDRVHHAVQKDFLYHPQEQCRQACCLVRTGWISVEVNVSPGTQSGKKGKKRANFAN